jgi:hypothetical protein
VNVVSHCANPDCGAPFLYLRDGKLFAVPRPNSKSAIEYFWLCGACSTQLELEFGQQDQLPIVVQRADDPGLTGRRQKTA